MVVQKATMTGEWREELTWAISRVWLRKGQQEALRLLALVGAVYGEDEEEQVAYAVMCETARHEWRP